MSFDDAVNGIARPIIGFFVGIACAYLVHLADGVGWPAALGFAAVLALLFGGVILFDRALDRGAEKLFGGIGIKPARKNQKREKAHWFVRFGWIFGLAVGFAAVFVLPEEALSWL